MTLATGEFPRFRVSSNDSVREINMSGQKPLHFLRATKYWSMVQNFLDDPSQESLELPKSVTASERDQVRQICKHFDVPFKVFGEGSEKQMVLKKPDFSYFEQAEADQRAIYEAEQSEIARLRRLVVQLSNDVNLERVKTNLVKHKLLTEVERETADSEVRILASEKRGVCGVCYERHVKRMSVSCGHSCCPECFDVARCPLCEREVTDIQELVQPEEPVSHSNKRSRHDD